VLTHFFAGSRTVPIVRAAIEGAQHTEYELRTVRKLIKADFAGEGRFLLTGVLDVVIQQANPLAYQRSWEWLDLEKLDGRITETPTRAVVGDLEIWDYKATKPDSPFVPDYARQSLTYAALFKERSGQVPVRRVVFLVNESDREKKLLAVGLDKPLIEHALLWTIDQVRLIRKTMLQFHVNPTSVPGGTLGKHHLSVGSRLDEEQRQQCTAFGLRYDCVEYKTSLGRPNHPDIALVNITKN
jgi:hypothetical protein